MAIMETIGGAGSNDTSGNNNNNNNNNNGDKSFTALHHNYHPHYQHYHHLHVPTASYHIPDDVKKMGYMQKLKFGKRNTTKFFVLRLNSTLMFSNATLAYYDNEKKFREKQSPKRVILLSECFAVARIPDRRYVLGIYTKEDLLATAFDDEKPFLEWLQAIRSILYLMPEFQMRPIRDFRYIWQGHVKNVSAELSKNLLGTYRFCLLPSVLYFIRVDPSMDNSVFYEFPLSIIHQCGRRDRTFYLRVGRLSEVGAGEFWILTDDNLIAEHMHLKVSSFWAMSKNEKIEENEDGAQFGMVISSSNNSLSQHRPSSSSNSSIADKSTSSYQQVPMGHNQCNPYLLYDDPNKFSISPFMLHQMMSQLQSFCRNNRNGNVSSLSQSPTTSRERLYSGSWSRTASDCSNDDSGSSSAVTTPVASMFRDNASASVSYQCSSPNGRKSNSFCSNFPNDFQSKPNSSNSSLFTELDHNEHLIMDSFHSLYNHNQISTSSSPSSSSLLTSSPNHQHQHQVSASDTNEERGFGAELDSFSTNFGKNSLCTNCLNLYSLYSFHLAQQMQQMNAANNNNGTVLHNHSSSHRSSNGSIGSHNQSPVTSPKCHCSACFLASVVSASAAATALSSSCCNQHHYLPTIPAGEPADYVPMKPLNGENNSTNLPDDNNKLNEEDESSYLLMSPVSPQLNNNNNNNNNKSDSKMSSNSFEFNLENVRSYISNDEEETSKDGVAKQSNNNSNSNKPTTKISPKTDTTNNTDDTIFNGLTRAYSTGSKPQPLAPSIGAQCANNSGLSTQNVPPVTNNKTIITGEKKQNFGTTSSQLRTRALSTGSHGMKFRAFLSSSKRKNKHSTTASPTQHCLNDCQPQLCQMNCGSSFSLPEEDNSGKRSNKAASAPILSSLVQQGFRVRSLTLGSKPSSVVMSLSPTSNTPLSLCPFSGHPMVTDLISNIYGPATNHPLACCATQHINSHPHYNLNLNLNHQYNMPNLSQHSYTVQSSQIQSPPAPLPSEESDMMEIDYSSKNKERFQLKQQNDDITSGGDDQAQIQLSTPTISQTKTKNDSKDIVNVKSQKRDITTNKSTNHWISTFKHTLSFQNALKHNKQHAKQSEQHSSDLKDNDYVLLNVGNSYVPTKPSVEHNTKSSKADDAVYSMLNYNRRQPALNNDSDEESSYVLMTPENSKSNNSQQQQKKSYKNSMKSLFLPGNSPLFRIN